MHFSKSFSRGRAFARACWWPALLAISLISPSAARATLLVYEGFNGYPGGDLSTATPNSNTIGLDRGTAYSGNGVGHNQLSSSSLSFSNLVTSGGSLFVPEGTTAVAAAKLNLPTSLPAGSSLYSSYLTSINFHTLDVTDGAELRVADNNTNLNERFLAQADSRQATFGSDGVAESGSSITTGSFTLPPGQTFLIVDRFTNVNAPLSAVSPGVATQYVLTPAQFDSFKAAGGTDAYLDAAPIGPDSTSVSDRVTDTATSGTLSFATGNFTALLAMGDDVNFDEVRYGTTLSDVTPVAVPEPASALLLLIGIATAGWRRMNTPGRRGNAG